MNIETSNPLNKSENNAQDNKKPDFLTEEMILSSEKLKVNEIFSKFMFFV